MNFSIKYFFSASETADLFTFTKKIFIFCAMLVLGIGGTYNPLISLPAGNYMFKVNNRNTRTRCEICSKLTIKTPERR